VEAEGWDDLAYFKKEQDQPARYASTLKILQSLTYHNIYSSFYFQWPVFFKG